MKLGLQTTVSKSVGEDWPPEIAKYSATAAQLSNSAATDVSAVVPTVVKFVGEARLPGQPFRLSSQQSRRLLASFRTDRFQQRVVERDSSAHSRWMCHDSLGG